MLQVQSESGETWYASATSTARSRSHKKKAIHGVNIIWFDKVRADEALLELTDHADWIPLATIERWGAGILQLDPRTGFFRVIRVSTVNLV